MFKYSLSLVWSNEDECYVATIAEFPGLSAFGDTPEEAAEEAKTAAEGFLKVYEEDGCPIPEPQTLKTFSGQTRLRLPKSLHASLAEEAKNEGVSLNTYAVHLLSERHMNERIGQQLEEIKESLVEVSSQSSSKWYEAISRGLARARSEVSVSDEIQRIYETRWGEFSEVAVLKRTLGSGWEHLDTVRNPDSLKMEVPSAFIISNMNCQR